MDCSVIYPIFHKDADCATALMHIEQQDFPAARYELHVLYRERFRSQAAFLRNYAAAAPMRVHLWETSLQNFGEVSVNALAAAEGRLTLLLSEAMLAGPHLIERHVRAHERHGSGRVVLGGLAFHPQMHPDTLTRWAWRNMLHRPASEPIRFADWRCQNISIEREALLSAGGFSSEMPTPLAVCAELGWRLLRHGLQGVYEEEARAYVWRGMRPKHRLRECRNAGVALAQLPPDVPAAPLELNYGRPLGRYAARVLAAGMPLLDPLVQRRMHTGAVPGGIWRLMERVAVSRGYYSADLAAADDPPD